MTNHKIPGQPEIPEERNPLDHDSRPDPSAVPPGAVRDDRKVASLPSASAEARAPSKVDDAKFLADEFDIPERKAVEAVADGEDAASLAAELHLRRPADDPLEGVPTPQSTSGDFTADSEEARVKPCSAAATIEREAR